MAKEKGTTLALFYCQNIPGSGEEARQALEVEYHERLRLFPLPCSGRIEVLHFLRALEEFADGAFLIACPRGRCRYFQGNMRALKRVDAARAAISEIGLEGERVSILMTGTEEPKSLAQLAAGLLEMAGDLTPSPVHGPEARKRRNATLM